MDELLVTIWKVKVMAFAALVLKESDKIERILDDYKIVCANI